MQGQSGRKQLKVSPLASSKQQFEPDPTKWKTINEIYPLVPCQSQESLEQCQEEDFPVYRLFSHCQGSKKLCNQEINHLGTYESRNGLPPLKFCTKPLPSPAAPIELRFSPSAGRAAQELWSTAGECKAGQKVEGDWHQKHMCVSLDHLIFTSRTPNKHVFVPPVEIQRN